VPVASVRGVSAPVELFLCWNGCVRSASGAFAKNSLVDDPDAAKPASFARVSARFSIADYMPTCTRSIPDLGAHVENARSIATVGLTSCRQNNFSYRRLPCAAVAPRISLLRSPRIELQNTGVLLCAVPMAAWSLEVKGQMLVLDNRPAVSVTYGVRATGRRARRYGVER
jgi:hypothetical protein